MRITQNTGLGSTKEYELTLTGEDNQLKLYRPAGGDTTRIRDTSHYRALGASTSITEVLRHAKEPDLTISFATHTTRWHSRPKTPRLLHRLLADKQEARSGGAMQPADIEHYLTRIQPGITLSKESQVAYSDLHGERTIHLGFALEQDTRHGRETVHINRWLYLTDPTFFTNYSTTSTPFQKAT